jgi:hypothetical protein
MTSNGYPGALLILDLPRTPDREWGMRSDLACLLCSSVNVHEYSSLSLHSIHGRLLGFRRVLEEVGEFDPFWPHPALWRP